MTGRPKTSFELMLECLSLDVLDERMAVALLIPERLPASEIDAGLDALREGLSTPL